MTETVINIPEELEEHLHKAFAAWVDHVGADNDDIRGFEDAYAGEWNSEREYADELLNDIGELESDSLASRYFDYEAFTNDLFAYDYFSVDCPEGGIWVFRNL